MLINVRFLFTIDSKISINDILKVLNVNMIYSDGFKIHNDSGLMVWPIECDVIKMKVLDNMFRARDPYFESYVGVYKVN